MDLGNVTWRKASHSGGNGGNCVEVGIWRKSSYSGGNGGECVEVGVWRKATHSGDNGGGCVEVATADTQIAVRDSKDPDGAALTFSASDWRQFIARAALQ
jgi:uncharacterized protein DUF397